MDSGGQGNPAKYKRLFPAYTLAELEAWVAKWDGKSVASPVYPYIAPTHDKLTAMKAEIAARKDGRSKPYKVPQI